MKKFTIFAMVAAAMLAACSDDDDAVAPGSKFDVITFEGDAWNSSVVTSQVYGSEPLYGETQYTWSDAVSGLSGFVSEDSWGTYAYAFSSGGSAISNFIAPAEATITYDEQLSVPGDANGNGGNNGSDNFLVVYSDSSSLAWGNEPAVLTFSNGAKAIDHLYLANTSFMLNSCINGDGITEGLSDTDWFTVTITGYDADGVELANPVVVYMAENGVEVMDWKKVDLSSLGVVSKIEFVCDSSVLSSSLNAIPGYIAIDDIAVVK